VQKRHNLVFFDKPKVVRSCSSFVNVNFVAAV
jgi:hypothetical protein